MDDIIKYQINNRCFIEPDVEQTQSYQQRNNSEAQNLMKIKTHGFEPLGQIIHTIPPAFLSDKIPTVLISVQESKCVLFQWLCREKRVILRELLQILSQGVDSLLPSIQITVF